MIARAVLPSKFLQSTHLQFSEQTMPAWKHSQYFFKHPLFLQLHPLLWRAFGRATGAPTSSASSSILGRNALGLRSRMDSIADWRLSSFVLLLQQLLQLHPSQYLPEAKHSQYSFKHLEFLQLHCFLLVAALPALTLERGRGGGGGRVVVPTLAEVNCCCMPGGK